MNLPDFFDVLDYGTNKTLEEQQENGLVRVSFRIECQILSLIASGDTKKVYAYYKNLLFLDPELKFTVGRLSKKTLQHFKYMAVSSIALICRVAIIQGVPEAASYSISDDAIQYIDAQESSEDVLNHLIKVVFTYTELIGKSKNNTLYSKPIRECIEYIVANLRKKITFDDLVAHTNYNRDYISRQFKKEVRMSVIDYILNMRIQAAKEMLQEGHSSSEIAYRLQFCSQSYFIKQFKKITGLTPKDYLNLYQIKKIIPDDIMQF